MKILIFKPDGIGDFVLATGAIKILAAEYGESQLTLVVRDLLEPLARMQFPRATIVALPLRERRVVMNLFVVNAWRLTCPLLKLRRTYFDVAISLRSMRDYLQNAFFFGARAGLYVATENLLARNQRWGRVLVERLCETLRRPYWIAYPECYAQLPLELEAHRRVLKRVLRRDISADEILPVLRSNQSSQDYILCAPFSAQSTKDYPMELWSEAMCQANLPKDVDVRLCGSKSQAPRLHEFAAYLLAKGFCNVTVILPHDLQDMVNQISRARMVWTVDTAAAHIALALCRPSLIAFSGLHKGMFAPWTKSPQQFWLSPEPKQPGKSGRWFERLSPKQVGKMMRQLEEDTK